MRLAKGQYVITAWAESAGAPETADTPVWVLLWMPVGEYRVVCLQPAEQTPLMREWYGIAAQVHGKMKAEAVRGMTPKRRKK